MWPAFTGPLFLLTLAANALANLIRNLWAFIIIFCGHFPSGVLEFTEDECEGESKGHWYFRQMLGSGNITGGRLFHIMSGNLSFQIEHHLFPDIPGPALPADRPRGARDLPALRHPLQHRPTVTAVRLGDLQDLPLRPALAQAPRQHRAPGAAAGAGRAAGGLSPLD